MDCSVTEASGNANLVPLSAEKLKQLETVLKSILALPIAQDTYAQIIDGEPTQQPGLESPIPRLTTDTTTLGPSDGAMQQYEEIRKVFRVWKVFVAEACKVDTKLAQRYQNAPLASREHSLRLLEITAACVNALAGVLYASFHAGTNQKSPAREHYVKFYHRSYTLVKHYPFGILNVVGYWAETQVFGGVLLFDRGDSGLEVNNAFVHPQLLFGAFQLSPQQITHFSDLSTPEDAAHLPGPRAVLPFAKDPDAHIEDVWVLMSEAPLRIYKNDYDKPPPQILPPRQCVQMDTIEKPLAVEHTHPNPRNPKPGQT